MTFDLRSLSAHEHFAVTEAAKQRAIVLREAAVDAAWVALARRLRQLAERLRPSGRAAPARARAHPPRSRSSCEAVVR